MFNKDTSFSDGVALGYMLGKNNSSGGSSDDNYDWTIPEDWLTVPEPAPNEVKVLVDIRESPETYKVSTWRYMTNEHGDWTGTYDVDFGNGYTQHALDGYAFGDGNVAPYSEIGQYIITYSSNDRLYYSPWDYPYDFSLTKPATVLMVKFGSNIGNGYTDYNGDFYGGFCGCQRLQYVKFGKCTINTNLLAHGNDDCYDIRKIEFTDNPTSIPNSTFSASSSDLSTYSRLTNITGLENVTSIGNFAFIGCENLRHIELPACTSVGDYAFQGCTNLKNIEIPHCTSMGYQAFCNCDMLKTINCPECTSVGGNAFMYDQRLNSVTFDEGCTYGTAAFSCCSDLYPRPDGTTYP